MAPAKSVSNLGDWVLLFLAKGPARPKEIEAMSRLKETRTLYRTLEGLRKQGYIVKQEGIEGPTPWGHGGISDKEGPKPLMSDTKATVYWLTPMGKEKAGKLRADRGWDLSGAWEP